MQVIDTHQHFWKYDAVRDSWITDEMRVIQRDFMPDDLLPIYQANGIDGCILVQTDQSEADNEFQLANAAQYDFIKGIVGWVDLEAANVEERLAFYAEHSIMKGFRHILQGEPQRDFMLRPKFKHGIGLLYRHNFVYEILIYPDQLKYTAEFVAEFPNQRFVINHLAKPNIRERKIEEWKKDMKAVAKFDNVSCKVSGMLGEKRWSDWTDADFTPYFDVVVEAFGPKRLMFGSDWPVCLVAGSYEKVYNLVKKYFSSFSKNEQDLVFGGNAVDFYNLGNIK